MKSILLISMPFRVGIGGFIRSWHVLPRLSRYLAEHGYEVEVYIPANALRTLASYLQLKARHSDNLHDEFISYVLREIYNLEKLSNYSFYINEKIISKNINYNLRFLKSRNQDRTKTVKFLISEEIRAPLIYFYEKNFLTMISDLVQKPDYLYSMHETADAIAAVQSFSSKNTKTAILLQSDLGRSMFTRVFNLRLFKELIARLKGLLAVSPAPILETPELASMTSEIRILIPGVAIDTDLLKYINSNVNIKKWDNAVIYFGRISREKGIFDLLKAWNIVERKINATLYIAGKFEDNLTEQKFWKFISKKKLKNIIYLGFLDRKKLFFIASRCKILAYPSYRDSFSITVLEALFMKLRVVAYDIIALRYIYSISSNVNLVPVKDYKYFAKILIENLEKNFEYDPGTAKVINLYSSWEQVSLEEFRALMDVFS